MQRPEGRPPPPPGTRVPKSVLLHSGSSAPAPAPCRLVPGPGCWPLLVGLPWGDPRLLCADPGGGGGARVQCPGQATGQPTDRPGMGRLEELGAWGEALEQGLWGAHRAAVPRGSRRAAPEAPGDPAAGQAGRGSLPATGPPALCAPTRLTVGRVLRGVAKGPPRSPACGAEGGAECHVTGLHSCSLGKAGLGPGGDLQTPA